MSKPIKSYQFRFMPQRAKVDVSVWEGKEKEGKALPSSLSLRVQLEDLEKPVSVYLDAEDAFCLSAILFRYATDTLELDTGRRLDAWKARQEQLRPIPV